MAKAMVLATFRPNDERRAVLDDVFEGVADVVYLPMLDGAARQAALRSADAVLAYNTGRELEPDEADALSGARLIQFVTAGVDFVPLSALPGTVPVACNGGGYAEPMAEHALAMVLAAYKRLFVEHAKLKAGTFDQFRPNRMLAGSVCGIVGFGGIGVATARVMKATGVAVHAVNRRGWTDEPIDWIGTAAETDRLLEEADIIVLSVPLTPTSEGLIGARELAVMKPDAVLVNLARGAVVDEDALSAHLIAHPEFTACIDTWWAETKLEETFTTKHDLLALPNVIGSPHNSATVRTWRPIAMRRAAENVRRMLRGESPRHLVPPEDRMT